jgi:hypothetical protein
MIDPTDRPSTKLLRSWLAMNNWSLPNLSLNTDASPVAIARRPLGAG